MKTRIALATLIVLVLATTVVAPTLAISPGWYLTFDGIDLSSGPCTPGNLFLAYVTFGMPGGPMTVREIGVVDNLTRGTSWSFDSGDQALPPGPPMPPTSSTYRAIVPDSTQEGDILRIRDRVYENGELVWDKTYTFNCSTGQPPNDGRINEHPGATVAIYCRVDDSVDIWGIDDQGHGYEAIHYPAENLPAEPPAANTLLAHFDDITFYMLTTGELQVNRGPDFEGKTYIFIWGGCPYQSDGYTASIDPNE